MEGGVVQPPQNDQTSTKGGLTSAIFFFFIWHDTKAKRSILEDRNTDMGNRNGFGCFSFGIQELGYFSDSFKT